MKISDELQNIISRSSFKVHEGRFIYAKVNKPPEIDNHFLVSRDEDEFTVVTREENLEQLDLIEKNKDYYSLIELKVSVPFYSVGFLAVVTGSIAEKEMNVLVVSTYSKDYILVRVDHREKALQVLKRLGFSEE